MHWGPYSVPGVSSEWFWYMVNTLFLNYMSLTLCTPQWNRRDPNNAGDMAIVK